MNLNVLGFPYQGSKTILLLATLILLVYQYVGNDYYSIKSTLNDNQILKINEGLFRQKIEDNINDTTTNKDFVCFFSDNKEQIDDCTKLTILKLFITVIVALIIVGFIPKYGEVAALGGGTLLAIVTIYNIIEMDDNEKKMYDQMKEGTPLSTLDSECVGEGDQKFCIKKVFGLDFWFNLILLILAFVILGLNGVGLFKTFFCGGF